MTADRHLLLITNEAEVYGIELACVQEIRVYQQPTRLPHAPPHVLGILNVGGQILPIIDLRQRLWGRKTDASPWHVIVLVSHGDVRCGILADAANEIAAFSADQIEELPAQVALQPRQGCFAGLASFTGADDEGTDRSVAMLDIAAIASFNLETNNREVWHKEISHV